MSGQAQGHVLLAGQKGSQKTVQKNMKQPCGKHCTHILTDMLAVFCMGGLTTWALHEVSSMQKSEGSANAIVDLVSD